MEKGNLEWIAFGYRVLEWSVYRYGGSKKLYHTLAWEVDDANILFIKMDWRAGNDESGFRVLDSWTVGMCLGQ